MKQSEISDEVHAALQRLATSKHLTPVELVASWVDPVRPALAGDHLLFHLAGAGFAALTDRGRPGGRTLQMVLSPN